jgi:hypothetical protein
MTLLITPLHLRVLLDQARRKVLDVLNCETWEDLRENKSALLLADEIYARIANAEHSPSREAVRFLCSYNNVRRSGNNVAHTAKPEEVKAAVLTKQLDSKERNLLEQLYTFTYELSV